MVYLRLTFGVKKFIYHTSNYHSSKKDLNISLEIEEIPFNDVDVFKLLSRGDTTGIFQLESEGVRKVLKRLQT